MNSDILHPDTWKYDLENRGYTVEETVNNALTLIVVKLSGTEVGRKEAPGREGIWIVREILEGGESLLPCLTTTQRDSIAFKSGHQIINQDNRNIVETWNGSNWNETAGVTIWLNTPVNKISGAPATTFTDIDISDDTGTDVAQTAIFSVKITKSVADAHRDIFIRKNGSTLTDNNIPSVGSEVKTGSHIYGQLHVPLDSNEICEYKANDSGDTTVDITLLGYIK